MWNQVLGYAGPKPRSRTSAATRPTAGRGNIVGVGPLDGCPSSQVIRGLCRYNRYERGLWCLRPSGEPQAAGRLPLDRVSMPGELLLADTRTQYLDPFQPYGPALEASPGATADQRHQRLHLRPAGRAPLNPTGDDVDFRYRFVRRPSGSQVQPAVPRAGRRGRAMAWLRLADGCRPDGRPHAVRPAWLVQPVGLPRRHRQ